ncbi:hypothetical protein KAR91_83495 [Candidatus Pacearchaeota archaeon]|nr:hypothetical protein [Candidatus Pacearchaeota archaeon]
MAIQILYAIALTGGTTGSLDNINPAGEGLVNGDKIVVITTSGIYTYNYNSASSATESSPDIIAPDVGSGRFELEHFSGAPGASNFENLIDNSEYKQLSGATPVVDVYTEMAVTDITSGVCLTANTQGIEVGSLNIIDIDDDGNSWDIEDGVYEVTDVVTNVSYTVHDTTLTVSPAGASLPASECVIERVNSSRIIDGYQQPEDISPGRIQTDSSRISGDFGLRCHIKAATAYWNFIYLTAAGTGTTDLDKFRGKPITIGCYVSLDVGGGGSGSSTATLEITDSDGTTSSATIDDTDGLTWLEVTRTPGSSITSFTPRLKITGASGDKVYVSKDMISYADYLGEGNFYPNKNMIYGYEGPFLKNWDSSVVVTGGTKISILTESHGRIARGVKELSARLSVVGTGGVGAFIALKPHLDTSTVNEADAIYCQDGIGNGASIQYNKGIIGGTYNFDAFTVATFLISASSLAVTIKVNACRF